MFNFLLETNGIGVLCARAFTQPPKMRNENKLNLFDIIFLVFTIFTCITCTATIFAVCHLLYIYCFFIFQFNCAMDKIVAKASAFSIPFSIGEYIFGYKAITSYTYKCNIVMHSRHCFNFYLFYSSQIPNKNYFINVWCNLFRDNYCMYLLMFQWLTECKCTHIDSINLCLWHYFSLWASSREIEQFLRMIFVYFDYSSTFNYFN